MAASSDGRVREAAGPTAALTRREREIAVLIAQGCSNKQIAEELVVTSGTVANQVGQLLSRLGLGSTGSRGRWPTSPG